MEMDQTKFISTPMLCNHDFMRSKKYFAIFSSMLQGKTILNICTIVSIPISLEFQVQEEIEKCLMFLL